MRKTLALAAALVIAGAGGALAQSASQQAPDLTKETTGSGMQHALRAPITGQCDQVRAGIAQHGLRAARTHAIAHYGLTHADLRTIEQTCGIGHRGRRAKR